MKIFRVFFLLLLMGFVTSGLMAQESKTQKADNAFTYKQYYEAADLYKKAYSTVKNKVEKRRILFQISECYRLTGNIRRAESSYKKTIRAGYSDPIVYLRYADILRIREKYDLAIDQYERYKEERPDDPRGERGIQSCKLAPEWIANPTKYEVEPIKKINSKQNDFSPTYADKKKKAIVFTSDRDEVTGRKSDAGTGMAFTDLFVTSIDRLGNWSTPVLIDEEKVINTEANEGVSFMNNKANTIYFTRCPIVKKERMGCQIYVSKKRGNGWGDVDKLEIALDSILVVHPTIDEREKVMYFASDMPGGEGGMDIWVVRRSRKNKPFGKPENLGPMINTPGNEIFPYLRQEGVLYFASDGHVGLGGLDIYRTELTNDGWSDPENMKSPINSYADDFGIIFEEEEKGFGREEKGFFTTNRTGGRGGDDIWSLYLPPLIFTLEGVVRDDNTLQLITGAKVTFQGSDGSLLETFTDNRGRYSFNKEQVLPLTSYDLNVTKEKYYGESGKMTTVGEEKSKDFVLNFNLIPLPVKPVVLPEIQYLLDDTTLQAQFQDSLNGLIKIMNDKPSLVIELIAHTDFRADEEYNKGLSRGRARSVVHYLTTQGIHPDRLMAVGKGESEPRTIARTMVFDDVTFPGGTVLSEDYINGLRTRKEKEAAHQLNRRTEFRIVRDDFIPPATNDTIIPEQIEVQINPDEDVIACYLTNDNVMMVPVVLNGLSYDFAYDKDAEMIRLSPAEAQRLLQLARINKNSFIDGAEAILEDGSIKDGSVFHIDQLNMGVYSREKVEAVVDYEQTVPLVAGDDLIRQFGEFTIDNEIVSIIFK